MDVSERHLWLIRHAKAVERDRADHDRELAYRGYRQCVEMGQFLSSVSAPPEIFVTSDARRTYTTAHFLNAFVRGEVVSLEEMYTFDGDVLASALLNVTTNLSLNAVNSVAVVGHNSAVSDLVVELSHRTDAPTLPTLGMAELVFNGKWEDLLDRIPISLEQIVKPSSKSK